MRRKGRKQGSGRVEIGEYRSGRIEKGFAENQEIELVGGLAVVRWRLEKKKLGGTAPRLEGMLISQFH
jgi:hypothetical protein